MLTSRLLKKIVEAIYTCFFTVGNHQQSIRIVPELGREPGTNDFESNTLAIMLVGLVFIELAGKAKSNLLLKLSSRRNVLG